MDMKTDNFGIIHQFGELPDNLRIKMHKNGKVTLFCADGQNVGSYLKSQYGELMEVNYEYKMVLICKSMFARLLNNQGLNTCA